MSDTSTSGWGREATVAVVVFVMAMIVIPPVVAALAYQSGQAMFWPALESLYTYFLKYTFLAALGVTALASAVRLVLKRLRRE